MALIWLLLILLVTLVVMKYRRNSTKDVPLPPGPRALPLLGHALSVPSTGQEMYFYELGLNYGDIVNLNVMGQSLVILNSAQVATELLDKRGANYSDRPDLPLIEMFGLASTTPFLKYGSEWRKQRAILHQYFNKEKTREYASIQTGEARILAWNLLTLNEDRLRLFVRFATAIIIEINYGHKIEFSGDEYLKIATECSEAGAESGRPGATAIDFFPFLRHFPSWFPGTHYANFARKTLPKVLRLYQYPYDQIMEKMAKGPVKPSVLASLIAGMQDQGEENKAHIKRIQAVAAVSYLAGADTTSATLSFFLLAMVSQPGCQQRAQAEIDHVVGTDRLPELQDRSNLPYIEAILQETLRWHPVVLTGVPHKTLEDDIYNGMLIPKGSIVIANARGMALDAAIYQDPFKFDPARFLPVPDGRGEPHPIGPFGFGRRICPGRHLAEGSVWLAIATILATLNISRAIGKDGKEIVPEEAITTDGIVSHASSFPCDIKSRSKRAFALLEQALG